MLMTIIQDKTHPTGVVDTAEKPSKEAATARMRKAKAALALRSQGETWEQIAETVGYPTPRAALVATEQALVAELSTAESHDFMRHMASDQLLAILKPVLAAAKDPNNPNWLQAVDRARLLLDQHADLHGYKSPKKQGIDTPTLSRLQEWVDRLSNMQVPEVEEADIFDEDPNIVDAEVIEDTDAAPAQ